MEAVTFTAPIKNYLQQCDDVRTNNKAKYAQKVKSVYFIHLRAPIRKQESHSEWQLASRGLHSCQQQYLELGSLKTNAGQKVPHTSLLRVIFLS